MQKSEFNYYLKIFKSYLIPLGFVVGLTIFFTFMFWGMANKEPAVEVECIVKSWGTSYSQYGSGETFAVCILDNGKEAIVSPSSTLNAKVGDRIKAKVNKFWIK